MTDLNRDECLKRRLLFAAEQCYDPDNSITHRAAGWTYGPAKIIREYEPAVVPQVTLEIDQKTDLAMIGRIAQGVLLAFGGTLPPMELVDGQMRRSSHGSAAILLDWLNDADCLPYADPELLYPGRVHAGFARSLEHLWRSEPAGAMGLEWWLVRLLQDGGPRHLYVTGHSKGGPLALLAAWRAHRLWPDLPIKVLTIAGARAGDADFADAFRAASIIECLRYEVDDDLVPFLPPGSAQTDFARTWLQRLGLYLPQVEFGYEPVGEPVVSHRPIFQRVGAFLGGIVASLSWKKDAEALILPAIEAHRIDAGSRYDAWVCEAGCAHGWA